MDIGELERKFISPDPEFTPYPFWFWNDELDEKEIGRQMREFQSKGVEGVIIHPRLGLSEKIGYLTEKWFYFVRYAVELARRLEMKVMLYDEAMYPSGSCHGQVVRENPAFASMGLIRQEITGEEAEEAPGREEFVAEGTEQEAAESEAPENTVAFFSTRGKRYRFVMAPSGGTIRGCFAGEDDGEGGAPKSADLLNPEAVESFIRNTHERYYRHLREYFGNTVIAIFTDEPAILGRCAREDMIAWSGGLWEEFQEAGGCAGDLYLLFEKKDSQEKRRAQELYQKVIYRRMSASYYARLAGWCHAHGIGLIGHPEKSTDIGYLQYFDIPCQDIVWRFVGPEEGRGLCGEHSTMAKCSSDSARHRGKRRNGNECFGCCSTPENPYTLSKADMKWYLDWLFVRGVNMIIPHAFYYSMRGERKDERPPEVGIHCEYWEEYSQISAYIKRMSWLMTDCVNKARVAVLCGWQTLSWELARPLYENQIEFNYLEEELLGSVSVEKGGIRIAKQFYTVILTDKTHCEETEKLLQDWEQKGVSVVRCPSGAVPIKAVRDGAGQDLELESACPDLRKTHIVKEGISFFFLTNEGEKTVYVTATVREGRIGQIWDPWTGAIQRMEKKSPRAQLALGARESKILVVFQD